ncbi:MAG TPA: MarR family transcriptional regulator [Alphaproteobacteria bacterium]|nr:MarR family transcriptional regulator [Alphaproteobacteria bacterium]
MDDEDIMFAVLVSDVARMLRTELDRRARGQGLTRSQWLALSRLARFPGVSLSELADMLEMEKAPAGRLIDRLEEGGWVRRDPDAHDRRIKRLYPTAAAENVYKKMRRITRETMDDALAGLSPTQQEQACQVLSVVKERLLGMTGAGSNGANGHDRQIQPIGS